MSDTTQQIELAVFNDLLLKLGYSKVTQEQYALIKASSEKRLQTLASDAISRGYTYPINDYENPYYSAPELATCAMHLHLSMNDNDEPDDSPLGDWIDHLMESTPFIPKEEAMAAFYSYVNRYQENDLPLGNAVTVFEKVMEMEENYQEGRRTPLFQSDGIKDSSKKH